MIWNNVFDIIINVKIRKTRNRMFILYVMKHFYEIVRKGDSLMDKRQQKSREAIFQAFSRLLSKKKYTYITVKDIIDEANIGRSTFYAHFETKDLLLDTMCTEVFAHVINESISHNELHGIKGDHSDTSSQICHILKHVQNNTNNILTLLSGESSGLFLNYFKIQLSQLTEQYLLDNRNADFKSIPESLLKEHILSSFISIIQWWIAEGLKHSPEEIEYYFNKIVLENKYL